MKLRGDEFGRVFNASGGRNLTGIGYPFHKWLGPIGPNYDGSTFIAKTTTFHPREGNMPLLEDGETPREMLPKCIYVNFFRAITLNAVGLSGPGFEAILDTGRLQQRTDPFILSFMPAGSTLEERQAEERLYVDMLKRRKSEFRAKIAIQRNFSCPNVGQDPSELIEESHSSFEVLGELDIPLIAKINAEVSPKAAVKVAKHPMCDAICNSNTIFWLHMPDLIRWWWLFPWQHLFHGGRSPLQVRGLEQPGGLGGRPLYPIVRDWIRDARAAGFTKPIMACGGLLSKRSIRGVARAGASA
ncbi:MAG: hypothetical protein WEC84_04405, partial [Candidatus Andersenbacteria bacterium]